MAEFSTMGDNIQLDAFFSSLPYERPGHLILDGQAHRFGSGQKGREPNWYVGTKTADGLTLTVGSHKSGEKHFFSTKKKSFRLKDKSFNGIWDASHPSVNASVYLHRKGIASLFGARISPNGELVIPMLTINHEMVGLQTIKDCGEKRFAKGSKKKGSFFELEGAEDLSKIFVAEGFATAATIMMATSSRVVCAFDSGNLPVVVQELSKKYPNVPIFVAGDDDRFTEPNAGRKAAEKVKGIAKAIFPAFGSDEKKLTDWNDLYTQQGLDAVKAQIDKALAEDTNWEFSMVSGKEIEKSTPPTKNQFVLPGLLLGHVGLLCSPGGAGKSGLSLLIANQIACGGNKDFVGLGTTVPGSVVIFSLEDPMDIISARQLEIRKDLSAEEYLLFDKNLHVMDARNLQGQMTAEFVINGVKKTLQTKPEGAPLRLIVIDHLSYWSAKDLNDGAQCAELIREFNQIAQRLNCAVLVLHHTNRNALMKGKDRQTGSVNIGGSYKLHSLSRWVATLEHVERYQMKELGISGSEEDFKLLLLDKVNHGEKLKILLKKRPERKGLLYKIGFGNNKQESKKEEASHAEVVSKEEAENFNMVSTSTALKNLDDNTHHIMTWLSDNPVFETVDVRRRKTLTATKPNGEEYDKDRPNADFYTDAWVSGDSLSVTGPVCDKEDMRLYALLVSELNKEHKKGEKGLTLERSLSEILNLSGITIAGTTTDRLQRQLDRLVRMSMDFQNAKGHRWRGPLINDVLTVGEGRNCKVKISFNQFMITFYKIQEFTFFNKQIASELKGNSLSFYLFFASQHKQEMKIPVEKCKKLLGISPSFDKKDAIKKIRTAVQDLVDAGVMDSEKTQVKDGYVYTKRKPA